MSPVHAPIAVSLYSGAGGLDLGFIEAGFEVVWANDADPLAVETYRSNIGAHAVCGDVLEVDLPDVRPSVVIGGPPCQGFSVIGQMRPNDPRSQHVLHFLDVVERLQPEAFVMENVKSLGANPRWAPLRDELRRRAERLGYATRLAILNASHFGVAQARERMFLLGQRGDVVPAIPLATSTERPPTVREALALLPPFGKPGNDTVTGALVIPSRAPIMRPTAHTGSLLFNGSGRPLHLERPAKTLPASMGGNATPIIDQDELEHGADPWVVDYHRQLMAGGNPLSEAPRRLRRLTVEEAAVLQSFPVGYRFHGSRVAQYRQVGNAVPPRLASAVARALIGSLRGSAVSVSA